MDIFYIENNYKRVIDIEEDYPLIDAIPTGRYTKFVWKDGVLYAQQWYRIR